MARVNGHRRRSLDDVAAAPVFTLDQRAAYAVCVQIYSGHECSCEQRGKGSVCDTMTRAAAAARRVFNPESKGDGRRE
jgi:hypothetical protein